ncbi:MAG: methylisocitrate lyase, partial [Chloroflexota bacterium]
AMKSVAEFEAVCQAVNVPVLANMTEFGKSELFSRDALAAAGVAMIIYPVTQLRRARGADEPVIHAMSADGTQEAAVPEMLTRARLYELVDYEAYNQFDTGIFNFQVPGLDITTNNANL